MRNFLTFLSLKAACLIPHLAIRESGVWLDEALQTCAYALLMHVVSENKRANQAVKCVFAACLESATASWDIVCERVDSHSFARSMSLLNNLVLRTRGGYSLT
jgi:hypothetical protein